MAYEELIARALRGSANLKAAWQRDDVSLIDELIAALREASKDAERYRWLRENWSEENPIKGRGGAVFPENPQEVDAAIDAAMEPK